MAAEGVTAAATEATTVITAATTATTSATTTTTGAISTPQKVCSICNEPILKHTCIHYGGLSCYSCRAFFRRSNVNEYGAKIAANYSCKFANECKVTVKTRRRCQKCRYDLCLKAGMRPEMVLTQEEKDIRFKKHLQKAKEKNGEESIKVSQQSTAPSSNVHNVVSLYGQKVQRDPLLTDIFGYISDFSLNIVDTILKDRDINDVISENIDTRVPLPSIKMEQQQQQQQDGFSVVVVKQEVREEMEVMLRSLRESLEKAFLPEPMLVQKLVDFHLGQYMLEKRDLDMILLLKMKQFDLFAKKQFENDVTAKDQCTLLQLNRLTFLNFILANYFSSSSGREQLCCIFGPPTPNSPLLLWEDERLNSLLSIPFQNYVFLERGGREAQCRYYELCLELRSVLSLIDRGRDILPLIFLYRHRGDVTKMQDPAKINHHFEKVMKALQQYLSCQTLCKVLNICDSLSDIFTAGYVWKDNVGNNSSIPQNPNMSLTNEEDLWCQKIEDQFDRAFYSVPMVADMGQEFLMLTYNVPLSRSFVMKSVLVHMERFRQVLKTHPEFDMLSSEEQNTLWRINGMKACGLAFLALESKPTGLEQMKFTSGVSEQGVWEKLLMPRMHNMNLKKLCFADLNFMTQIPAAENVGVYQELSLKLSALLAESRILKLLMLLTLFSYPLPQLSGIYRRYFKLVHRIGISRGCDLVAKVTEGMEETDKLATMAYTFTRL